MSVEIDVNVIDLLDKIYNRVALRVKADLVTQSSLSRVFTQYVNTILNQDFTQKCTTAKVYQQKCAILPSFPFSDLRVRYSKLLGSRILRARGAMRC